MTSNQKQMETTYRSELSSIPLTTTMTQTSTISEYVSTDQTTLTQQLSSAYYSTDLSSNIFSETVPSTTNSLETNVQNVDSTTLNVTLNYIYTSVETTSSSSLSTEYFYSTMLTSTSVETVSDHYTTEEETTSSSSLSTEYIHSTTLTSLETTLLTSSSDVTLSSQELSTDVESTSLDSTLTTTSDDITSPDFSTSLQNQFHSSTMESSDESLTTTESSTAVTETSTLSVIVTSFFDKETKDDITEEHSSTMLLEIYVSSILYPSSLFNVSSTIFTHSLPPSYTPSSITITETDQLLSSEYFSVATTTSTIDPFTTLPSSISTFETTDLPTTSDITEESSMVTLSDEPFSSPLTTSYPDDTTPIEPIISSESSDTIYATSSTEIATSTSLDSTSVPFITTPEPLTTTVYWTEYISTPSSLEIISTTFPDTYYPSTAPFTSVVIPLKTRTDPPSTTTSSTSTTTTSTTTTTVERRRTRRRTTTHVISSSSTSATSTNVPQTTSSYNELVTSSTIFRRNSRLNSYQQQMVEYKPSFNTNSSNTLLSNELLNMLFNNTNNSSAEKLIFLNLFDLPPSSWNLSFTTNESILLDISLPPSSSPGTSDTTTNLTFTNVEANRFSTNIVGLPVNLQVDHIQTKQFSLAMNLTNDQSNQSSSDVVIGRIKSETFELNITKSDNMNVHVQQVDSETAELFFDSQFCTNESNLQINLNLSKNGNFLFFFCFVFQIIFKELFVMVIDHHFVLDLFLLEYICSNNPVILINHLHYFLIYVKDKIHV